MAKCSECGAEGGSANYCKLCGGKLSKQARSRPAMKTAGQATAEVAPISNEKAVVSSGFASGNINWKWPAWVAAIVTLVAIIGFSNPVTWEKTDIPEQPETFHSETVNTGKYDVVSNNISPCFVGQEWYLCVNTYVAEFNSTCGSAKLTTKARGVCDSYSAAIDEMKAKNKYGAIVSSLGTRGSLSLVPETTTKRVSNNDYRAAVTHTAKCYFGFIGECEKQ